MRLCMGKNGRRMLETFDLKGKVAFVTGGGSGLGRVMALALAEAGADVALGARGLERLERVAGEIRSMGRRAVSLHLDVTDPASVEHAAERAEDELAPLDILVNNSGISGEGKALELSPERWDGVINTNLRGTFLMCQAVGGRMVKRNRGTIVNVASVLGMVGNPSLSAYAASKGGIIQLTRTLALEWARNGVRVNALAPGYVATDLNRDFFGTGAGERLVRTHIPMGRTGQPEEVAGAVVFLGSEASSFMTGAVLCIDGGQSAQ